MQALARPRSPFGPAARPLSVERLEDRTVPSAPSVLSALDHGVIPLRQRPAEVMTHSGTPAAHPALNSFLTPASSQPAGRATVLQAESKSMSAEFYSVDPTGAIVTQISVFVSEDRERVASGEVVTSRYLSLAVSVYNVVTDQPVFVGAEVATDIQFRWDAGLRTASVVGDVVILDDLTTAAKQFHVNLTWTGTGDLQVGNSNTVFEDVREVVHQRSRAATAVGTITVVEAGGTTNYTPNVSTEAFIQHVSVLFLEIPGRGPRVR